MPEEVRRLQVAEDNFDLPFLWSSPRMVEHLKLLRESFVPSQHCRVYLHKWQYWMYCCTPSICLWVLMLWSSMCALHPWYWSLQQNIVSTCIFTGSYLINCSRLLALSQFLWQYFSLSTSIYLCLRASFYFISI